MAIDDDDDPRAASVRALGEVFTALATIVADIEARAHVTRGRDLVAELAAALDVTMPALAPRPRVLVVDDDDANLLYARAIYEDAGADVVTETDASRAIDLVATGAPFSFVLIDLQMPGIGGLGLLRALRLLPTSTSTPLVVLSANGSGDSRAEARAAGADDYIVKPASPATLTSAFVWHTRPVRPIDLGIDDALDDVDDLLVRRPRIVTAVIDNDRRGLALIVGAIRLRRPRLARALDNRLAARDLPGLLADVDAAIEIATTRARSAPTTAAVRASLREAARVFADAAREEHRALQDVLADPTTETATLRAVVKATSHRLAGSAATFGHPSVGQAARMITTAIVDADEERVRWLTQGLLFALGAIIDRVELEGEPT